MEAKTELSKVKTRTSYWLGTFLSSTALLFISGVSKAEDSVNTMMASTDTAAADSAKSILGKKGIHSIDDGGVLTYSLIIIGIIVIIGFAFLTSMRKNKSNTGAPVGYRKATHHHHHKHNHKI